MLGKGKGKTEKRGPGRKYELPLTEDNLERVYALASLKCTHRETATGLSVAYSTWMEAKKRHPEFQEAYEDGSEAGNISLRRKQFKLADKSAHMAKHLGEVYLNQIVPRKIVGNGPGGSIPVVDLSNLSEDELDFLERIAGRLGATESDRDGASEEGGGESA